MQLFSELFVLYAFSSDNVQSQSKHQFGPSTSRMGTARPPSARPAPPRPKSSLLRETEESNYRFLNVLFHHSFI